MNKKKFFPSEDGVSEVVDFVTVLGVMVLAIGLIAVAGYPILRNAQEAQQVENTKQSFTVLADNLNKVVLGQTPSQSVELKLYGGMLSVTGNSALNITANSTNKSTGIIERIPLAEREMRSIESEVGGAVVAYEGTGVWAKYPSGSALLVYKPLITNKSNVLVIPVVFISGTSSIGGSGISRVTAKGAPRVIFYQNVSDIQVIINSTYWDAWRNYFQDVMSWSYCTTGECTVKLETQDNIDVYILDIQLDTTIV